MSSGMTSTTIHCSAEVVRDTVDCNSCSFGSSSSRSAMIPDPARELWDCRSPPIPRVVSLPLPRLGQVKASPPEVLVIGGGFAGLHTARSLAGRPVHVTIVDRHNFHTFQPLLYQVATAGLEPGDVAYPLRTIFSKARNVTFRHGIVTGIDAASRQVTLADGGSLRFDHLVVACGAAANFFGIAGAAESATPLYTLADARHLRDRLLLTLEDSEARSDRASKPVTVVIVGGGPTGIETAGAVAELLEVCLHRDRLRLDPATTKVVLLDVSPRLLGGFPPAASTYALETLSKRGVEVRLSESVVSLTATRVTLASGESIESSVVIWAAGVTSKDTVAATLGAAPGPTGRIAVARDLSVPGFVGVWAVGDGAAIPMDQGDRTCPQLAPVAIQSGRHCGRQILNVLDGRLTQPFAYKDKGIMATIGRNAAVAKVPHLPLIKGRLGWLAWMSLHLFYLAGFRNRIRVFVNWTWRYFDWPSGPRLIMADAERAD
jgi:NADH:ubiquinone reductase (H+-translocating)